MTPTKPKRKSPNTADLTRRLRAQYMVELTRAASHMTEEFFGIPWQDLMPRKRDASTARARRWAAWWMHGQGLSTREVGMALKRTHKAVETMIALARWEDQHGMMNSRAITEIAEAQIGDWRRA